MLVKGFNGLSLTTPACHPGSTVLMAEFHLDTDISPLFPYINAVVEGAKLHESPSCVIFALKKIEHSMYPDRVCAGPFVDREQAEKHVQGLIDFLNDLESRRDSIEPSFDAYRPPVSVLEILKLLPRTNCKKCGAATCMAFASALSKGELQLHLCSELQDKDAESYARLEALLR